MVRFYIVNYKNWSHHIVIVVITYMIPDCDIIKHMLSTDASMSEAFPKSRLQCWGYSPILPQVTANSIVHLKRKFKMWGK